LETTSRPLIPNGKHGDEQRGHQAGPGQSKQAASERAGSVADYADQVWPDKAAEVSN
jgi:hypothetical protein